MRRVAQEQLNIRSAYARDRVRELARKTGMSATRIVEEALRGYAPAAGDPAGRLQRKGALLVMPRPTDERPITGAETLAAIDSVREERASSLSR